MKNLFLIFVAIFALSEAHAADPIHRIKKVSSRKYNIEFKLDQTVYKKLRNKKSVVANFIDLPDAPAIPFSSFLLEGRPDTLKLTFNKGPKQIVKKFQVSPKRSEILKRRCSKRKDRLEAWTEEDYKVLEKYSATYRIDYLGKFRGTPLSKVTVYPVQYKRAAKEIVLYPEMKLTVESKSRYPIKFFNARESLEETLPEGWELEAKNNKLLVVVPRKFSEAMDPFVLWKRKLGFDVDVRIMENLGRTAEQIKDSIHKMNRGRRSGFSYAIFVGNEEIFPSFYGSTSGSSRTPTDLPYFTFDGEDDFIPDAFYSRFVVATKEDIERQISKIIAYEKAQHESFEGFRNGIGIASNEGYDPSDEDYIKMVEKSFGEDYGSVFSLFFQSSGNANARNINDAFEKGSFWLTYIGHGSGRAWSSTNDNYDVRDVVSISPTEIKPVIIDVACMNGKFMPGYFGETFMNGVNSRNEPTGASAYYGGSVNISWHPPAIMSAGINKVKQEYGLKHLGQILLGGQFHLFENWHDTQNIKDNITWYHLFGDATMNVRVKTPQKIAMKKTSNTLKFTSTNKRIRNKNLKDQVVVFHNNADKFTIVKTDSAGVVKIPSESGLTHVSVLAENHQYFESTY